MSEFSFQPDHVIISASSYNEVIADAKQLEAINKILEDAIDLALDEYSATQASHLKRAESMETYLSEAQKQVEEIRNKKL